MPVAEQTNTWSEVKKSKQILDNVNRKCKKSFTSILLGQGCT